MDSGKYLLNSLDVNIRHHLIGLARTNPDVQIAIDGVDAIIRKDVDAIRQKGQVLIVSGGGAGHEPMFAGFVGKKHLTAAVSGSYFASPSAGSIVKLIKQIATRETPILLIQANYTGDRLNFGLAKEYLTLDGFKHIGWFVFADDLSPFLTANQNNNEEQLQNKRRGLAGIAFIHKIAGVLSEQGKTLLEIEEYLKKISNRIFTLSVSLSPCDIPGHGSSFQLKSNEMELGLGVHGESGIKRIPLQSAKETVQLLLNELIGHLKQMNLLMENKRIALMINNLGGLIPMEMNVLRKEVIEQLSNDYGIIIERIYSGAIFTSFNMKGVSLSIILVDDDLIKILDESNMDNERNPTIINHDFIYKSNINLDANNKDNDSVEEFFNHKWKFFDEYICKRDTFVRMLQNACQTIINNESVLNKLDETVGDSDCGSTLANMAKLFLDKIITINGPTFATLANIVKQSTTIGGTSGAIYSILFTAAENFVQKRLDILDVREIIKQQQDDDALIKWKIKFFEHLLNECIMKISTYGGAKINDRSMIDGLYGVVLGLKQCNQQNCSRSLPELVKIINNSTWTQTRKTAMMKANVGRAAYVNETIVSGVVDAGAYAVALWTEAILDIIHSSN